MAPNADKTQSLGFVNQIAFGGTARGGGLAAKGGPDQNLVALRTTMTHYFDPSPLLEPANPCGILRNATAAHSSGSSLSCGYTTHGVNGVHHAAARASTR